MVVGVILLWRRKPVLTKKPQGRPTLEYNYLNQLNKPCLVKISIKCTSEKYTVHERHFQNTLSHSYLLPITLENMHTIVFFNMNLYCFPSRFKGIFKYALKHILNEEIGRWVMVMCVTCISCWYCRKEQSPWSYSWYTLSWRYLVSICIELHCMGYLYWCHMDFCTISNLNVVDQWMWCVFGLMQ